MHLVYQADKVTTPLQIGDQIASRGGSIYTISEIRNTGRGCGFTITRESSGKAVRISNRLIQRCLVRLQAGELLRYQCNTTKGGISYTVAIEAGVVGALQPLCQRSDKERGYRA